MFGNAYARWMYRWETRLTTRDENRVVRPLEWGFEWIAPFLEDQRLGGAELLDAERQGSGAAEAAMANATPLEKNAYKIPIFEAIVRRTILRAAGMKAEGVAA